MFFDALLPGAQIQSGGAAAALAGVASVATSEAGAITTGIPVAGTDTIASSASGTLSTGIPVAGSASVVESATGGLVSGIPIAGSATVAAGASGQLTTGVALSGSVVAGFGANAALSTIGPIAGAGSIDTSQAGDLSTQVLLAGQAQVITSILTRKTYRSSQLILSLQQKSSDNLYWGDYPQGGRPASMQASATIAETVAGAVSTAIKLAGQDSVSTSGTGTLTSSGTNPLGMNLGGVNYADSELPYLNLVKQGGSNDSFTGWFTSSTGGNDTGEEKYLQLDSDGYVKSLVASPTPPGGQVFNAAFCLINFSLPTAPGASGPYPGGTYRLQFTGNGQITIEIDGSLTLNNTSSGTVSQTFNVTANAGLRMRIDRVGSSTDYPHNISIVENQYAALFDGGATFHPNFLAKLSATIPFSPIRFMDWLSTNYQLQSSLNGGIIPLLTTTPSAGNTSLTLASGWPLRSGTYKISFSNGQDIICTCVANSTTIALGTAINSTPFVSGAGTFIQVSVIRDWSDRPVPSNVFYTTYRGVPHEVCIALCQAVGADAWINIHSSADDTFVTNTATLYHTTLFPRKVRAEYQNEPWNSAGPIANNYRYAAYKGQALFTSQASDQFDCLLNWQGKRTAEISDIFFSVYGSSDFASGCVVSLSGQCASTYVATQQLDSPFWVAIGGTAVKNHHIGSVHVAVYVGGRMPDADYTKILAQSDGGLNYFFQLLYSNVVTGGTQPGTYGVGLPQGGNLPAGGWFNAPGGLSDLAAYVSAMASYGNLPVILYESGQNFYSYNITTNQAAVQALMLAANRDARMGTAYTYLYNHAKSAGAANPMCVFDFVYSPNQYGNWGVLESSMQPVTPNSSAPAKWQGLKAFTG